MQSTSAIRRSFLDFFVGKQHKLMPSSPLVPVNDSSLLFTNAGMVQFKDIFLGHEKPSHRRVVTSQRCVRAGGKHNDLENVGYTRRHHTFFEMLGNFSFGNYSKEQAILYAWEYLVEVIKLPPAKLWVTVFEDDIESERIWLQKIGVDADRCVRIAGADNFWTMGEVGPCGPCTEIFYDHGPSVAGTPPGTEGADGDRYTEIWNLVFMQYERTPNGRQHDLPALSVDTGMGLERLAAVLQGVHDNYDIDLFRNLIKHIAALTDCRDLSSPSLKVIADHIRSAGFLVTDGIVPSNEGRGYVLRRIIRRALRHGHKLHVTEPFFYRIADALVKEMGDAFPELAAAEQRIADTLREEERQFSATLATGISLLEEAITNLSSNRLPGTIIFKLYDTYGFPVDLTADIAREKDLTLDMDGFETLMRRQKQRAKSGNGFSAQLSHPISDCEQHFSGYDTLEDTGTVTALFCGDEKTSSLEAGDEGIVVLANTPFYAESGGQVGDSGCLQTDSGVFEVRDTKKQGLFHKHIGVIKSGRLRLGDTVTAKVSAQRRRAIMRNHSATHLLHAALKAVLGDHVEQRGSLVAEDRLRFDFSHNVALSADEIKQIEALVNEQVLRNTEVRPEYMAKEDALKQGAVALFGEKYADQVRVLTIGEFSKELCGGTHVRRSGDIGVFKITSQTGVAAGIRRLEAISGHITLEYINEIEGEIKQLCDMLNAHSGTLCDKVGKLLESNRELKKRNTSLPATRALDEHSLLQKAVDVCGVKVVAAKVENVEKSALRSTLDSLKEKFADGGIILLATVQGDKRVTLIAGVTDNLTDRLRADDLVNHIARQVGGRGGGRADMAEAGGKDPAALDAALATMPDRVRLGLRT